MSNSKSFIFCAVLLLAGCASNPTRPAAASAPARSAASEPAQPDADALAAQELRQAAAQPSLPFEGEGWQALFDGQNLQGWRQTPFASHGLVECQAGLLILNMGEPFTGVTWTNAFPKTNYEVALDAMRLMGTDFFCGLTVPVGESFCSLIVGGWGGTLLGISSIDGLDASENETMKYINFEPHRWYRVRLRVTPQKLEGWLDNDKLIDVALAERRVSLRLGEIELCKPMGLACWQTSAALRHIQVRPVSGPASPPKARD